MAKEINKNGLFRLEITLFFFFCFVFFQYMKNTKKKEKKSKRERRREIENKRAERGKQRKKRKSSFKTKQLRSKFLPLYFFLLVLLLQWKSSNPILPLVLSASSTPRSATSYCTLRSCRLAVSIASRTRRSSYALSLAALAPLPEFLQSRSAARCE